MQPIIVSYYTPGTHYETRARALRKSVERLGLESRIEPRASRGSWVENCAQKSEFVRDVRQAVGRPVLWLDADAVLLRPLSQLDGFAGDFAAVKRDGWNLSGGQLYFGTGPVTDALVETWCRYCRAAPNIFDQVTLTYAWWQTSLRTPIRSLWLPETTFDKEPQRLVRKLRFWLKGTQANIVHKQESRRSRKTQGRPAAAEFDQRRLPQWWRDAMIAERPFPLKPEQWLELGFASTPEP